MPILNDQLGSYMVGLYGPVIIWLTTIASQLFLMWPSVGGVDTQNVRTIGWQAYTLSIEGL